MSLNTVEGWNAYVKEGHSRILKERDIEPTEENLAAFQAEVTATVDKLQAEVDKKREKERIMRELYENAINQEVQEILRIAGHMEVGFPPYGVINEVYDRTLKKSRNHAYFALANVWYAGYIQGIRAERSRRKVKSPTTAATGGGAGQEDTKQATDIIPQNQ